MGPGLAAAAQQLRAYLQCLSLASALRLGALQQQLSTLGTNLIIAQRAYEMNSKVITTADQMLSTNTQMKQ